MSKIVKLQEAYSLIDDYHKKGKSIVLVGGCFDILHIGHIHFLKKAKRMGDILAVILESDEKVKLLKGNNRPFFTQKERAQILSSIKYTDFIILLPFLKTDEDYNKVVFELEPNIIVITENDLFLKKKKRQAKKINAEVKIVPYVKTLSSSELAKKMRAE